MLNQATAFEHPLNERVRVFLRLEHLFEKIDHYLPETDEWATRSIVGALLDILSVVRLEIKDEVLAELERYTTVLENLEQQTGVDSGVLKRILEDLGTAATNIRSLDGQTIKKLHDNEFLKSVLQRSAIPGGACGFDLPHYSYWLHRPQAQRQIQISAWLQEITPLRDGVALLLSLIRGSCDPREVIAIAGLYQHSLDAQVPIQMVRVQIDSALPIFPEISGHKHRFNIRFMESQDTERPVQIEKDVSFLLTCCVL